jgi:ATP-dependent RNA helicase RhlE
MPFEAFGLCPEILRAVEAQNYKTPTPIQEKAIPFVLEGKDILGCAQTGTGKTAAFALPILQRLRGAARNGRNRRSVRALVLAPTRELATQIAGSFGAYGRHTDVRCAVVYGGVSQRPQEQALRRGVDLVVATPGRLLDLMSQGLLTLCAVEILVLDEADRMLDMGFIRDIRRIIDALPVDRQTLFFSATLPGDVKGLAASILRDPVRVAVAPVSSPAEAVDHFVYYVEKSGKGELLRHLLADPSVRNALVFTRTRRGAERLARQLIAARIPAEAIHGDKSQSMRERALADFKRGLTRVLVATDVASRGLDITGLSHVINFDLPDEPENYVHRIGRTGRAGASGIALSLCGIEERSCLADIERLIRQRLTVVENHPFRSALRPGPPTVLDPRRSPAAPRPYLIPAEELFKTLSSRT